MEYYLVADGKQYNYIREEGLQNFADYPYHDEYSYANGSYFWVPESGYLYLTDVFEALPDDVKSFDIVEFNKRTMHKEIVAKGVNISGDAHLFDGIKLVVTFNLTFPVP